jgi:hypothetical protein
MSRRPISLKNIPQDIIMDYIQPQASVGGVIAYIAPVQKWDHNNEVVRSGYQIVPKRGRMLGTLATGINRERGRYVHGAGPLGVDTLSKDYLLSENQVNKRLKEITNLLPNGQILFKRTRKDGVEVIYAQSLMKKWGKEERTVSPNNILGQLKWVSKNFRT